MNNIEAKLFLKELRELTNHAYSNENKLQQFKLMIRFNLKRFNPLNYFKRKRRAEGFKQGDTIIISGSDNFNGSYKISEVTSDTTFKIGDVTITY